MMQHVSDPPLIDQLPADRALEEIIRLVIHVEMIEGQGVEFVDVLFEVMLAPRPHCRVKGAWPSPSIS